ncbi:MAG: RecX family transcriptional regulator [Halobacteriovoraceae bacterium]|nr:RecX family transcriptional regulator [Halobacteriovoraceae bacterium]
MTEELFPETPKEEKKCYNAGLRLIARKDYSEYKLKQKLKEKSHEKEVIDQVIHRLKEENYLREDLYRDGRIKGLLRKGYSEHVVSYKMDQERCPATVEDIQLVAEEMGLTQESQLLELVEKKVRIDYDFVTDKKKLKDRVLRYVHSRGHSVSKASSYYDQVVQKYQEELD